MNLLRLVARPLLAAPFVVDGIDALLHPDDHVERARVLDPLTERLGLDLDDDQLRLATRALGATTVITGAAFATGRCTRTSALVLAGISVPLAVVNHPVRTATSRLERRRLRDGRRRALALTGALLIASTDRRGAPSALWRWQNRTRTPRVEGAGA